MYIAPVGEGPDYSHVLTEANKRNGRRLAYTVNALLMIYPLWEIVTHLTI